MQTCSAQILNLMRFHCKTAHIRSQHFCVPIMRQMNEKIKRSLVKLERSQTWDYPAIAAVCRPVPSSSLQPDGDDCKETLKKSLGVLTLSQESTFLLFPPPPVTLLAILDWSCPRQRRHGGQRLMGSCGKDMDGWVSWLGAVRTEKGWAAEEKKVQR